ncbi:MAG: ribose-phosphate pyrophosphokinase [Bacillota bacterium]|nr:ribose-phosphate pyrophosphokinase [Bacillota bacterium]
MTSENKSHKRPHGNLGIIALKSAESLGDKVNEHLLRQRKARGENFNRDGEAVDTYLVPLTATRFSNGEGKVVLAETARGKDVYILADVSNYSIKYKMYGMDVSTGPDEHFMDIKRTLSAMSGRQKRVTVVMPLLYASRQHRKKARESLDCAMALQELATYGVDEIITFDAHDPTIQNAIPNVSFLNIYPTLDIVKVFLTEQDWILNDDEKLVIISPDTGAMDRAIYYSSMLGVDIGLFYKRRDHSRIVNGKNPIVQHEYIGPDISGINVLIVDDMIASGESVFDIAKELRARGAKKIFVACTFAFFTEGIDKFNRFHEEGMIEKVYSTNLNYVSDQVLESSWFSQVDLSEFLATFIDHLNYDHSAAHLLDATKGIRAFLAQRGYDWEQRKRIAKPE